MRLDDLRFRPVWATMSESGCATANGAMAKYFLHVKVFSRGKGSRVTRAAAYRAGERIRDERTSEVYNYSDRQDVPSQGDRAGVAIRRPDGHQLGARSSGTLERGGARGSPQCAARARGAGDASAGACTGPAHGARPYFRAR